MPKGRAESAEYSPDSLRETVTERRERALRLAERLSEIWPDAECELAYGSAWELLISTMLAAQCTDKMVNQVTPALFEQYPDPPSLARAPQQKVEKLIRQTGFFSRKAKAIRECAQQVTEEYSGEVPRDLDLLVKLNGVGRKTASVVLGTAFGSPAVFVDTHVKRLSRRFGLSCNDTPEKIESDLKTLLPPQEWVAFCHRTIWHGRRVCHARRPTCDDCGLADLCPRVGVGN